MLTTLKTEMMKKGIKSKDIANLLGTSINTIHKKISGHSELNYREMMLIRDNLFPYMTMDELFMTNEDMKLGPDI